MGIFDFLRGKPKSILEALQSSPEFQKQKEIFDVMSVLCESGVDADELPGSTGEYGLTCTNPIPCKTVWAAQLISAAYGRPMAAKSPTSGLELRNLRHRRTPSTYTRLHTQPQESLLRCISPLTRSAFQRSLHAGSC